MFSHQACPFLLFCLTFSTQNCKAWNNQGVGKSVCKQGLHKPDLTYFVKRLKCELTANVLANITCLLLVLQSSPLEHSQSCLSTVT